MERFTQIANELPIDLENAPRCVVCDSIEDVGIRRLMCKDPICKQCFFAWYDGAGITQEDILSYRKQNRDL